MIIALTGRAGSGKSTAARMLQHHYHFKLVKFAAPIKNMLRALDLQDAHLEGIFKDQPCPLLCGRTPRHAMQTLGTEWGRQLIGDALWVNAAMHEAGLWEQVVMDDLRYINEAAAVHAHRGLVWRIERPGVQAVEAHASESQMDGIVPDALITNNGSLEQLQEAICALYNETCARPY